MKTLLWIGAPSVVTFSASMFSHLLENIDFFFVVSTIALFIAIMPRLKEAAIKH